MALIFIETFCLFCELMYSYGEKNTLPTTIPVRCNQTLVFKGNRFVFKITCVEVSFDMIIFKNIITMVLVIFHTNMFPVI